MAWAAMAEIMQPAKSSPTRDRTISEIRRHGLLSESCYYSTSPKTPKSRREVVTMTVVSQFPCRIFRQVETLLTKYRGVVEVAPVQEASGPRRTKVNGFHLRLSSLTIP